MFSPTICTHKPYLVAVVLKTAIQDCLQCENAGDKSEDERDVESPPLTPPPSPSSPSSLLTPLPSPLAHEVPLPRVHSPSPSSSSPPTSPLPLSHPSGASLMTPGTSSPLPSTSTWLSRKAVGKTPCPCHCSTAHAKAGKKSRQLCKRDAENAHAALVIKKVSLYHRHNSDPVRTTYSMKTDAPTTQPGWVACNTSFAKELLPLETLVGPDYGMVVVPWDGV
jgi:hypothetical protein